MKKLLLPVVLSIIILTAVGFAADNLKYVKVEEPPSGKAKNSLVFKLDQLTPIIDEIKGSEASGSIELTNSEGAVLAVLGTIADGEIKWDQEALDEKSLLVKFNNKADYESILKAMKEKAEKPGLLAQYSDDQKTPMANQEITFAETPDLVVTPTFPLSAAPGESLTEKISVDVENKGIVEAANVHIELGLSSDLQIPSQPAAPSENFKEDMLLDGGREIIPLIKPGERLTVKFKGSLKVPADTPFGKYYMSTIADPENKIKEVNKENNKDMRLLMVNPVEPKKFTLLFTDTQLIYNPANYDITVVTHEFTLSEGKEWRKCNIKPNLFQVKHAAWEDFLWEVNTTDGTIVQLKGGNFCKRDGKQKKLSLGVEAQGGSAAVAPSQVILKLSDTSLVYEIKEGKFKILTDESQIAYVPFWTIARVKPLVYQVKYHLWTDSFLEVDCIKNEVRKITGGKFGLEGGTAAPFLDVKVTVEN